MSRRTIGIGLLIIAILAGAIWFSTKLPRKQTAIEKELRRIFTEEEFIKASRKGMQNYWASEGHKQTDINRWLDEEEKKWRSQDAYGRLTEKQLYELIVKAGKANLVPQNIKDAIA